MAKSITTEEFVKKAKAVHGDKYDYSKVEYVNAYTKVCIICPEHGEFWQRPNHHLKGCGCPECGVEKNAKNRTFNTEEFIKQANQIHKGLYIYTKVKYVNSRTKVCIICPEHGEFLQKPNAHISGKQGCPECGRILVANKNSKSFSQFEEEARKVHGDKYEYDASTYTTALKTMRVICPEHGEFWQTPNHHLRGTGCPKCVNIKNGLAKRKTFEQFVEDARKVHGDKYIYNGSNYQGNRASIGITCPKHGEFWQRPYCHLQGCGCPKCSVEKNRYSQHLGFLAFKERAEKVHNNKYIYNDSNYINNRTPITITCPIHGEFLQTPNDHLYGGCGCPKCSHSISNPEEEINNFINTICHIETITRDRKLLGKNLECDIIVPSHKLAIEFDGIIWHSEKFGKDKGYHLHKTELAESKGYHLIHIFEDEWLEHKDLVLSKIRHFLGCDTDKPVIGARKCTIESVSKSLTEPFLNTYHLQGFVGSTVYYGAFHGNEMVGVMTFKQEKNDIWNLNRFATDTHYRLPGLADKLFKRFIKDKNPREVKTFLDRRWSHGNSNVYEKMGFSLTETLPPDYRYVVKNQRLHKFGFRKQILAKKYNLPLSMTEREMTEKLGFYRIWDCGLYKYVWKR